ncbi:MAG: DHH family phosphoesterase, partial [Candidatus Woesearchaeota archaeon]
MVQKRKANPFKQFRQDILRYKSIVLATHTVPDADSLFCLSALEAICKELNPEITVYPVAESSRAGLDCKTILQKYGLKYLEPNADIPENPDAVFLVDTQLTRRAVLPISLHSTNANESQKDDLDGRLELEGIEVHVRDHHRSQESDSLVDRADFKTYFIDDEKFHSCAALLLHEFADTKFVRENLAQNEGLCTLGHQAIRIDSPGFRNLTDADTNALKIFGGGKLNHEVIHGVNNLPLSDVEGNLLAVMLKSSSRMQLEGFATYCHLGIVDPDREKEYILPTVTDEMLRMASTNGIAVASAVYKGVNGSESELACSFRLNGTASNLNAANIARLF